MITAIIILGSGLVVLLLKRKLSAALDKGSEKFERACDNLLQDVVRNEGDWTEHYNWEIRA